MDFCKQIRVEQKILPAMLQSSTIHPESLLNDLISINNKNADYSTDVYDFSVLDPADFNIYLNDAAEKSISDNFKTGNKEANINHSDMELDNLGSSVTTISSFHRDNTDDNIVQESISSNINETKNTISVAVPNSDVTVTGNSDFNQSEQYFHLDVPSGCNNSQLSNDVEFLTEYQDGSLFSIDFTCDYNTDDDNNNSSSSINNENNTTPLKQSQTLISEIDIILRNEIVKLYSPDLKEGITEDTRLIKNIDCVEYNSNRIKIVNESDSVNDVSSRQQEDKELETKSDTNIFSLLKEVQGVNRNKYYNIKNKEVRPTLFQPLCLANKEIRINNDIVMLNKNTEEGLELGMEIVEENVKSDIYFFNSRIDGRNKNGSPDEFIDKDTEINCNIQEKKPDLIQMVLVSNANCTSQVNKCNIDEENQVECKNIKVQAEKEACDLIQMVSISDVGCVSQNSECIAKTCNSAHKNCDFNVRKNTFELKNKNLLEIKNLSNSNGDKNNKTIKLILLPVNKNITNLQNKGMLVLKLKNNNKCVNSTDSTKQNFPSKLLIGDIYKNGGNIQDKDNKKLVKNNCQTEFLNDEYNDANFDNHINNESCNEESLLINKNFGTNFEIKNIKENFSNSKNDITNIINENTPLNKHNYVEPKLLFNDKYNKENNITVLKQENKYYKGNLNKISNESIDSKVRIFSNKTSVNNEKSNNFEKDYKNITYVCLQCKKRFTDKFIYKIHLSNCKKNVNNHNCKICGKFFKFKQSLNRHKKIVHEGIKGFACKVCDKKFTRKISLNLHQLIHKNIKNELCVVCGYKFRLKRNLQSHLSVVHHVNTDCKIKNTETKIRKFTCEICNKTFNQNKNLREHKKNLHDNNKNISKHEGKFKIIDRFNVVKYKCLLCNKLYKKSTFVKHFNQIHRNKTDKYDKTSDRISKGCDNFNKNCDNDKNCENEPCDKLNKDCDKVDRDCDKMKESHDSVDKEIKKYLCNFCDKYFIKRYDIIAHINKFHNDKSFYECNKCNKKFKLKSSLKNHKIVHNKINNRPFSCDKCSKTFQLKSVLYKHQVVHSGFKKFKCEKCEKIYSHKHNLTKHILKMRHGI